MLELVSPHVRMKASFLSGLAELQTDSDCDAWVYLGKSLPLDLPTTHFELYVATLLKRKIEPPAGFVCDSTFWAIEKGEVVGRISVRHELNEFLSKIGGHIGYIVRPTARGRGVASQMLKQVLDQPIAQTIGRLLLTCDETNIASRRTIEKCGGILESAAEQELDKPRKLRFWIELA